MDIEAKLKELLRLRAIEARAAFSDCVDEETLQKVHELSEQQNAIVAKIVDYVQRMEWTLNVVGLAAQAFDERDLTDLEFYQIVMNAIYPAVTKENYEKQ